MDTEICFIKSFVALLGYIGFAWKFLNTGILNVEQKAL